ncbi:ATP-binding cassette transporter [Hysterangium stoloniferum]|nr:ATP-binding cassette transporter [Hysterangium stoloniferum]
MSRVWTDDKALRWAPANPGGGTFLKERRQWSKALGATSTTLRILRFLATLTLTGLTVVAFISLPHKRKSKVHFFDDNLKSIYGGIPINFPAFTQAEWIEVVYLLLYSYTSVLALLDILPIRRWYSTATIHLTFVMTTIVFVYTYRDLFPYATFTLRPADGDQGWLLWSRLGLVTFAGLLVPLAIPRIYTPVDPFNPSKYLNTELTASWWSYVTYSYLDPLIVRGARTTLSYEDLPPLADYDMSTYLMARMAPPLDPYLHGTKRHIFWGLMSLFCRYSTQVFLQCLMGLLRPVALNKLLNYLEDGQDAFIKPWFWALCLFIGPSVGSLANSFYTFTASRIVVHAEAIITQVLFNHTLRIRKKEETTARSGQSTITNTLSSRSMRENGTDVESESRSKTLRCERISPRTSKDAAGRRASDTSNATIPNTVSSLASSDKPVYDSRSNNLAGKITNLITTDLSNIADGREFIYIAIYGPLQFSISAWFLYVILDWSAIVGIALTAICIPLPGYIITLLNKVQTERMKKTDARVQSVIETLSAIRMIKQFGWEDKVNKQISKKREAELVLIKSGQLWRLLNDIMNYFLHIITMVTSFACYTMIQKQALTAATVFTSIAVFGQLRGSMQSMLSMFPVVINANVSLSRINDFLQTTQLLDRFVQKAPRDEGVVDTEPFNPPEAIGFRNAAFTWSHNELEEERTISQRNYSLHIEGELFFKPGKLNLIIGPTGSGKTSMLMALLGELHFEPCGEHGGFNLPRDRGVAYAAQEAWVRNETIKATISPQIKNNILFGKALDHERYKKVLRQCCLELDLSLFEAGDETEVGEKGVTLSGGQKSRITLARAVYSDAQILLLDDILAALDVHTSRFIVDECLQGDLLQGRTVLLVTQNVPMVASVSDFVVSLGTNGTIARWGSVDEVLKMDRRLLCQAAESVDISDKTPEPTVTGKKIPKATGNLVVEENSALGNVGWHPLKLYLSNLGNISFWIVFIGGLVLSQACNSIASWFLGYWASQYEHQPVWRVPVGYYLSVYALILSGTSEWYCIAMAFFVFGAIKASRNVHQYLITSILGTTLRWLDTVPTARIISRFTQDLREVDGPIPQFFAALANHSLSMLVKLAAVIIFVPQFLLPGLAMGIISVLCGQMYLNAQFPVKREMSNRRSPVIAHFDAAIAGLVSIRAYGAQAAFMSESLKRIDEYTRPARIYNGINRWIGVRIEAIGATFPACLALYLAYSKIFHTPSEIGFSLTMAVAFSDRILECIRVLNKIQVQGNSLERIEAYLNIDQETKPIAHGVPPAYWPASGSLIVENLCARYSADGPEVLHNISFEIKSGERIGVVGHTGSGKSSLTLSLLRCIPTDGQVLFDGLATSSINLNALRSSITIIPQVPELLSGTLRENLDPFSEHSDATLNDALRSAGLFKLQEHGEKTSSIMLDSAISGGGRNLSVGQRQILALARAILRRSKLLILDEATSAIDYATDSIIQNTLRKALKDVTLITVAHRLQTIMDADKIVVLDTGNMVEFDTPNNLLKKDGGYLKSFVDESGDRAALYEMAEEASRHGQCNE